MLTKDAEFRIGDTITIFIKNRPYIDFEVPPDLNDFRDCDFTELKIYDPNKKLILETPLRKAGKPGWYYFRFNTNTDNCLGLYKVVVKLSTEVAVGELTTSLTPPSTGVGTTGTTGTPLETSELISDVQIRYFRLNSKEVF
jgi:hypothetical protein